MRFAGPVMRVSLLMRVGKTSEDASGIWKVGSF
jgi:hypothetical protein